jgi:hypothetical protein
VAAHNLLKQAEKAGARFPIIFADAGDDFDGLIYYGFIKKLNLDGNCTTYSFDGLSHIDPELPKNTLKLRSTGAHLSNAYIRPYAIVHMPGFIRAG